MRLLGKAIFSLRPGSEFVITDNDYSTIQWYVLEGEAPTLQEVETEMERIAEEEANAEIDRQNRRAEILERLGLTEDEAKLILG